MAVMGLGFLKGSTVFSLWKKLKLLLIKKLRKDPKQKNELAAIII
jgi:hypothetical protein